MKYAVIKHADIDRLCRHVNQLLGEGWTCQGGIAVCDVQMEINGTSRDQPDGSVAAIANFQSERHYAQAMVLHDVLEVEVKR